MNTGYKLDRVGNNELMSALATLVKRGNELTAELLAHLAEVDRRRLHLELGYPSLFAYCIEKLRLSEPAAGRRIAAARVCRRFPTAFDLVAKGDLHLSALCALQPHLNPTNATELFEGCRNKTRRQIEELIARRFPRADVRLSIRRLPEPRQPAPLAPVEAPAPAPVSEGSAEKPAQPALQPPPAQAPAPRLAPPPAARTQEIQPLSAERYGVHFTASASLRAKIEQARDLASHRVDPRDLAALMELAFDALVRDLLKERFAVGRKPRATTESLSPGDSAESKSRHIPAAVAREVYERDKGRCTFVSRDGRRCAETRWLQVEHIHPWARGGPATSDNLCLLCRAHNQHQARARFGADFVERAMVRRAREPTGVRESVERQPRALGRCPKGNGVATLWACRLSRGS